MNENKSLELKVGIFVFIGLLAIGIMAIQFGRLGQGLSKFYELKVEFKNANGLLKNSDVQLAGSVVGHVVAKPRIEDGNISFVTVHLRIRDSVRLPRGSQFQIGSSGLMGDKSVTITPPSDFDKATFNPDNTEQAFQPGDTVRGSEGSGIEALTRKSEEAMEKLSANLDELRLTISKLQRNLLSDENLENFSASLANIKTTGENFAQASERLGVIVSGAQEAVESAKATMVTANAAAGDIRLVLSDARNTIKSAEGAIKTAEGAMKTAESILKAVQNGKGPVSTLIYNREVAENLSALISNIRRHGMLFYRDSAAREQQQQTPVPMRVRRR